MQEPERVIDEYTLAAFLAGTLPDQHRQEVIGYLAANPDAREVLHMAAQALEAARSADPAETAPADARSPAPSRTAAVPVRRSRQTFLRGAGRYVAATLFVFVVGMVLRLSFGPPGDALRSPVQRSEPRLQVDVSRAGPSIEWPAVENAYRYRLVIWDPVEAEVAGEYETPDHTLGAEHTVMLSLRSDLRDGHTYSLRVDAIDAQNRLLRSSESVEFSIE